MKNNEGLRINNENQATMFQIYHVRLNESGMKQIEDKSYFEIVTPDKHRNGQILN